MSVHQEVRAESGFAYGVIGGDINVFGDGPPLYVLETWRPAPQADPGYLRQLPSRMLNARFAVVPFTGRAEELAGLRTWRDEGPRLAVRWLHAPGGQGKSRLSAEFAHASLADGWKVVTATHGPGTVLPPPGSQDLRLTGATGLLLIVDYADRWPPSHLTALFSNALLHQTAVRTRVLLLGRSADLWPAVRGALANHQAATSTQLLAPLPGGEGTARQARAAMFAAARDSFAAHYGTSAAAVSPPGPLDAPEFGLTLAVHTAALVAVDAYVTGRRPPGDMANLTIYLLDREHLHWQNLYGDPAHELDPAGRTFTTPPETMNRTVFTAALTGTLTRPDGTAVLGTLRLDPAAQILTDHAACYPPAGSAPDTVLAPLYPDRLAEDFLALTVPGHTADYPAQHWATPTVDLLLDRAADRTPAPWTPRTVTFLAAAAERWPHLGPACLYPLLRQDPGLAIAAGSAALTALAGIPTIDPTVLEAVEARFPPDRHTDLSPGIAALTARLAAHLLAATDDPARHAGLYTTLAVRQSYAGLHSRALAASEQAVAIYRHLAEADPAGYRHLLANALSVLGNSLADVGRRAEALTVAEETVEICRGLAQADPAAHEGSLAPALVNLGIRLGEAGRHDAAVAAAERATEIWRRLAQANPAAFLDDYATSLNNLSTGLARLGRGEEALATVERAVEIRRHLTETDQARYEYELATSLGNLTLCLAMQGRRAEASAASEQAMEIWRRLARANPAAHELDLATSLTNLGRLLPELGRHQDALAAAEEAVEIWRRLARANPARYEPEFAASLNNAGRCLGDMGRDEEALAATGEAVGIRRRLADANPAAYEPDLAMSLTNLGCHLSEVGRHQEALAAGEQSAALYRRLALTDPVAYEPDLARSLDNLGNRLTEVGRHQEALTTTEEALRIWRRLARANPAAYEPDLAMTLHNLGADLAELRRFRKAVTALERSAALHRRLAQADPAVHSAGLARTLLASAAVRLVWGRDLRGALRSADSAAAIYLQLADRLPAAFTDHLRHTMQLQAELLARLGRRAEAEKIHRLLVSDPEG
ncbi:tetratricopeptide repeat protein [Kitasatospora sp. HPMI-4]|uniref:tetratricopeptide repeat protein n=1 Tax=Kitasatospora sp. HPMI-4 TaxID=3448443 RepID=UPI003F199B52